jgi:hypothetical protein
MSKANPKFCNLHTFVKKENPSLYELLEDMCAVGLFRPKHPTTFINPSKEVVAKLKALIEKGESDVAFEHLQKHFLFGKHPVLKGELITYNSKAMKTDLSKTTTKNDKFSQWSSRGDNVVVFTQTNTDFLEEGAVKERPKLDRPKKGKGESNSQRMEATKELLQKAANGDNIMHVFAKNVNGLLEVLKKHCEDNNEDEKIKLVMSKLDPNPVLCWYILVKPSAVNCENLYIDDHVFNAWFESRKNNMNNDKTSLLRSLITSNGRDKSLLAKAQNARGKVNTAGFAQTRQSIISSYDNDMCGLLEDELRFRLSDKGGDELVWNSPEIVELNNLNWNDPEQSLVLLKSSNSLLNSCLHKIMQEFVNSNSFHYTMYDDSLYEKLEKNIVGAGNGAKKIVKILGKEGRKLIKSMEDADEEDELSKFVSSLNKRQLGSLKKILKSM